MGQPASGDVGVDALIAAGLGVVLAPIARVHRHHLRQRTGCGRDALEHGLQVLDIRRLDAYPHRHDHLVVTVHRQLSVVALQVRPTRLHEVAVGVGEVALGLLGWCAIGLPGQAPPGHRITGQRLQIRRFQAGLLGLLDRLLPGGSGFCCCRLGLSVQLALLSRWSIRFASRHRFSPGLLSFLLPLPRRRSSGFGFHLFAGLTNPGQ